MSAAQLELLVAGPETHLLQDNLELIIDALEDASAWRESQDDIPSADAYQTLAARLEQLLT